MSARIDGAHVGDRTEETGVAAAMRGLSDPADPQRLVEAVGDIDVLVNNAGFARFGATTDLDVATFVSSGAIVAADGGRTAI